MREINVAGLTLVKKWEGVLDGDPNTVNLDPYLDPVGIWTIGWGHAIRGFNGKFLRGAQARALARAFYPDGITTTQAQDLLRADLLDSAKDVSALVRAPMTDNQFSALVSFEFNTGGISFPSSTIRRLLNAKDYTGAADQFARWNKGTVNGKKVVLPGLVTRRAEERKLFMKQ